MIPSIIYCDLDGVLADFDRHYETCFGLPREKFIKDSDAEFWQRINLYRIHSLAGWFNNLPPMPNYDRLWNFLTGIGVPVAILTATGKDRERARKEKLSWVESYLGKSPLVLFVDSGKEKCKYATKSSLLIDDTPKCITPWRDAGGIGILHTDIEDTVSQVKQIMGIS